METVGSLVSTGRKRQRQDVAGQDDEAFIDYINSYTVDPSTSPPFPSLLTWCSQSWLPEHHLVIYRHINIIVSTVIKPSITIIFKNLAQEYPGSVWSL